MQNFTPFKKQKTKTKYLTKKCRKKLQNLHAAQTISRAPNQSVKNKIVSASKDVDAPREM